MNKTRKNLISEIEDLRAQLEKAEALVCAMQSADTDASAIAGPHGERVFALNGAERPYRLLIEEMSEGAVTLSADGIILYCNKRFADMLKTPHEKLVGSYINRLVMPEDQPAFETLLLKDMKLSSKAEINLHAEDGSYIPVLLSTKSVNIDGIEVIYQVVTDLTEQKRNEAALRQSEERFQIVARATNDVVWDWDLATGRVWWNERFYPQFGYTGHEVMPGNGTWADLLHPADAERVVASVHAIFEAHEPFWSDEYRFRCADGTYAHVLDRGYVKYNSTGEPVRMTGSMMDITERMRVEKELLANAEKLARTNRELQDFAYVASHDLQEPLRKIRAFGDRLKSLSESVLSDDALSYLERMQNAASRMQELIDDLLIYSQITTDAQPFARVDLGKVAQEVLSDLVISIEQTDGLVELGDLPTIEADPVQMRQLLQNLIGNALKYHKKGVTPVVKVYSRWDNATSTNKANNSNNSNEDSSANTTNSANNANSNNSQQLHQAADHATKDTPSHEQCQVIVEDNGIGFDEKYVDRIFTPFERLHSRVEYEGTGIGLAVCRKIAEHHGGGITAKSVPGQGAKFIVTLPANREWANQLPGDTEQCTNMSSSHFQY